jgi:mRNA interferase MazF
MPYLPQQGDMISADAASPNDALFPGGASPDRGTPPMRRPFLVISSHTYSRYTNLVLVCPVTAPGDPFPMHVPLDRRTSTDGIICCEQITYLDISACHVAFIEKLPADLVQEVTERVLLSFE